MRLNKGSWDGAMILYYLGKILSVLNPVSVPIREKLKFWYTKKKIPHEDRAERERVEIAGLANWSDMTIAKEHHSHQKLKRQGADSPLKFPEGVQPCCHLDFNPVRLTWDYWHPELWWEWTPVVIKHQVCGTLLEDQYGKNEPILCHPISTLTFFYYPWTPEMGHKKSLELKSEPNLICPLFM